MPSQRDRARAAVAKLPKLDFGHVGELRAVLAEAKWDAAPDGSVSSELHDDLCCIVSGIDGVIRALERIRLRQARRG